MPLPARDSNVVDVDVDSVMTRRMDRVIYTSVDQWRRGVVLKTDR